MGKITDDAIGEVKLLFDNNEVPMGIYWIGSVKHVLFKAPVTPSPDCVTVVPD